MIPDIPAIVEMLIAKQCTAQQALKWLEVHMDNADLRDQFAGMAMQAMETHNSKHGREFGYESPADLSARSYRLANAMIAERNKL